MMISIVRLCTLGIALVLVAIVGLACANEPVADQAAASSLSAEQVEQIVSKALEAQAMENAAAPAGPTAEEIGTIVSEVVADATSSSLSADQVEQIVSKALEAQAMETITSEIVDRDIFVPTTISSEAQLVLGALIKAKPYTRAAPAASDLENWRKVHDGAEAASKEGSEDAVARNSVTVAEAKLGGVPVLDIRPENWADNGKVLVYTHGGAYTLFSARSTLPSSAKMSRATGMRIISVNYTTAPFANWEEIQEQVISVFEALLAEGYTMNDIALYGDSAGGGLATSTVLNLRDRGMGMPAVVVLWSPWVDLTNAGDTAYTLKDADPTLSYIGLLDVSAQAFADGLDLSDPRVSPINRDFSKGFPPTLIQAGTKEIFLSTAVRLYQTLEAAGQDTKLDIYEGMWHIFQQTPIPETEVAVSKSAAFINKHLE